MDPVAVAATTSVGALILDKLLVSVGACFLRSRRRNRALVCITGKTELVKTLYSLADETFQVVDVEGETMLSLKDDTKATLEALAKNGSHAQRTRLFNLYAKAYVKALVKNFPKSLFLFVTSTHQLAHFACNIPPFRILTAIPSGNMSATLTQSMSQLDKADYETNRIEAVRACQDKYLLVFDTWNHLTNEIMRQYNLSHRL
jgi:hypothetical protein